MIKDSIKSNIEEIRNIRKKTLNNYKYTYYKGDENSMEKDVSVNEKYGDTREGYDLFKNESMTLPDGSISRPGQIDVSYAGIVSLRTITDRDTNNVIGYITEEKLSHTPYRDAAMVLYNETLEYFKNILGVVDIDSLNYWLNETTIQGYNINVETIVQNAEWLESTLEEYNDNEEFRKYFNKIIK